MIKTRHFLSTIDKLIKGDRFKFASEQSSDSFFVMWTAITSYGTNIYMNNANDRSSLTQELNTKRDAGTQVQISRPYNSCA